MSYSRQYHEVVSGTKTESVAVSYPASQSGGTTYKTVTMRIDIPVNININVDTNPFDSSVRSCEKNITLLTGAVVATETATIVSKHRNAKKVGETIVNGFFSYVKSEISQQIAEITQQTEALLMHIRGLSESCIAKKEQMHTDYNRISSRYLKLFNDLNRELASRIHQLDQRTFLFKELADELQARAEATGAVSTVLVFNAENTNVQVKLNSALAKKQAADAMQKIAAFLSQQKQSDVAIRHCMQDDNHKRLAHIPLCISEMTAGPTVTDSHIFIPVSLPKEQQKTVRTHIAGQAANTNRLWVPMQGERLQQMKFYFNKALNERVPSGNDRTERVRKMIQQLAKIENIETFN